MNINLFSQKNVKAAQNDKSSDCEKSSDKSELKKSSKYDEYKQQDNEDGNEDWSYDRHSSIFYDEDKEVRTKIYGMIDIDNNCKFSEGWGNYRDVYLEYEYMEEWQNENFLYKVADDMDNDGQYQVTYYDSSGNISVEGKDTDRDGVLDSNITVNNNCDGKIDTSYQGSTNDCWLLSSVNAMSYTDDGEEILKNAIEVNKNDGSTVVHTYFGDYTISLDELQEAKLADIDGESKYSTGDDDVLVLELAIEKVLNDYEDGKIDLPISLSITNSITSILDLFSDNQNSSIDGGFAGLFNYIMTGESTTTNITTWDQNSALSKIEEGNATGACLSSITNRTLDGPDGDVYIYGNHTYAIKSVDGDVVTLVNPYESDKELKIYRSQAAQIGISIEVV